MYQENYITIPLSKTGIKAGLYDALVSKEDADLANYNWSVQENAHHKTIYARRTIRNSDGKRVGLKMHHVVIERMLGRPLEKGEQVDHINLHGWDNRRENLRLVTQSQNQMNSSLYKSNKSGYRGVKWDKQNNNWRVDIQVNKKKHYLGSFDNPEDGYKAYCKASKELHGEYSNVD